VETEDAVDGIGGRVVAGIGGGTPSNGSGGGISVGTEPGLLLGWLESLVGTGVVSFNGGRPGRFQDMEG
jgi:hypothetical protein